MMPVNEARPRKMKTPKIYFGTRTHKQLRQIIRELRKTKYRTVRSVVLGSRDYTCIHPVVSRSKNKNEGCRNLLNDKGGDFCQYHQGANKLKTFDQLASYGLAPAWDLEDMITLGKRIKACPYYSTRGLVQAASIVFCPYQYLIDPLVRDAMDIVLNNQIVVLDEAHNIEDCAREAASFTLTQDQILEARNDLEQLHAFGVKTSHCQTLIRMLSSLSVWMSSYSSKLTDFTEFNQQGKIFSGQEMIAHLNEIEIGITDYLNYVLSFKELMADTDSESDTPQPLAATAQLLKGFFMILQFLFKDNLKHCSDYKIALIKSHVRSRAAVKDRNGWQSIKGLTKSELSLNFWCLNPAVAFSEVGHSAFSVILTSGTLAPMNSFQSELGIQFKNRLEANHVISRDQVWIGTIGQGPSHDRLLCTFKCTETLKFQDELGHVIVHVCTAVPKGILCFFPSYAVMEKLVNRWQSTGLWGELCKKKRILTESRKPEEFEENMHSYYDAVSSTSHDETDGALFLAVCRGKVSEGLDFTDDNARAVIAIGIPFPNIKDVRVDLKRQFNNQYCKERGLLSGSEWYEIQAFRALNQALGRCIRHKHDWGALILIDQRFQQFNQNTESKYILGLSKWVRNSLQHYSNFSMAIAHLQEFTRKMSENPPKNLSVSLQEGQTGEYSHADPPVSEFHTPSAYSSIRTPPANYPLFTLPPKKLMSGGQKGTNQSFAGRESVYIHSSVRDLGALQDIFGSINSQKNPFSDKDFTTSTQLYNTPICGENSLASVSKILNSQMITFVPGGESSTQECASGIESLASLKPVKSKNTTSKSPHDIGRSCHRSRGGRASRKRASVRRASGISLNVISNRSLSGTVSNLSGFKSDENCKTTTLHHQEDSETHANCTVLSAAEPLFASYDSDDMFAASPMDPCPKGSENSNVDKIQMESHMNLTGKAQKKLAKQFSKPQEDVSRSATNGRILQKHRARRTAEGKQNTSCNISSLELSDDSDFEDASRNFTPHVKKLRHDQKKRGVHYSPLQ